MRSFLPNLVAVVSSVLSCGVSGLGRPSGSWEEWGNGCEVLMNRLDRFDCKCLCCFGTVQYDGLPNAEPVLDVGCRLGLGPSVNISVGVADE